MNKKEWREYMTEEGERWTTFSDSDMIETKKDFTSREGDEAVTCVKFMVVDYVIVSFIPCACNQEVPNRDVNYEPFRKKDFHLKLELMNGDEWFCFSQKHYTKEEVIKLATLFVGLNRHQAERVWNAKKLGAINTYRID